MLDCHGFSGWFLARVQGHTSSDLGPLFTLGCLGLFTFILLTVMLVSAGNAKSQSESKLRELLTQLGNDPENEDVYTSAVQVAREYSRSACVGKNTPAEVFFELKKNEIDHVRTNARIAKGKFTDEHADTAVSRIEQLESLLNANLISEAEYQLKRKEILDEI